ncbi:MAG: hypothetical protein HFACDABA_01683 [Anaerolineales bacterium]|nr:hypothetical protein [Anaerolineales bacterium]
MGEDAILKDNGLSANEINHVPRAGFWKSFKIKIETWRHNPLLLLSFILFILFVLTALWVIFATIVWPVENAEFFRQRIPIDQRRYIEVWGPTIIPDDKEFVDVQFTLHQENIIPIPVSVELSMPRQFVIVSPTNEQSRSTVIKFDKRSLEETQTIRVANAHIVNGLGTEARMVYVTQISESNRGLDSFALTAEGSLRAKLRNYGGSNGQIPLFPLTTLFLSVATFIFQEIGRRRKEREDKEKEKKKEREDKEKEKKKEAEDAITKQREKAKADLINIREALQQMRIDDAQAIIKEIQQGDIRQYIEKDLQIAQGLVAMALGEMDSKPSAFPPDQWMKEAASVLLYLAEHNPKDRSKLEKILREFPLDQVEDSDMRKNLETAKSIVSETKTPAQTRAPLYPPKRQFQKFAPPIEYFDHNPFPFETAEEDECFLFTEGNALFWSDHPLTKDLKSARGATLVTGEAGIGKTALAQALGNYRYVLVDPRSFSIGLQGIPTLEDICEKLARRLLDFVERLPSFLILLNEEQRSLLGQTLIATLDKGTVIGRLGLASDTSKWNWLNDAGSSEEKRKIWKAEASVHLRMLLDSVSNSTPHITSNRQWALAFTTCLRSLGFENAVYIAIDSGENFNWDWYEETILDHQYYWKDLDLHSITFCPSEKVGNSRKQIGTVKSFELKWDEKQLEKWAHWRWESVYGGARKEGVLFDRDPLQALLKASRGNPRCFIRLWNALARSKQKLTFTITDIKKAKEQIDCS